jgi:homocysteine S-methyltransferase
LIEGGVDLIVVETMIDPNEAHAALLAARDLGSLPVVVQMTIQDDGATNTGIAVEDFTRQLDEWGADVIGLNCSTGPAAMLEALDRMAVVTARRLSAQPNAGLPSTVDGRSIYLCSPEYMASYARRFMDSGARLIGGCCGSTPAHIQAIKAAVRSLRLPAARASVDVRKGRPRIQMEPVPVAARSSLGERLERQEFTTLAEIVPPKGSDVTKELEGASYLAEQHLDGVVVPDGSGSTARLSAQTLAVLLAQKTGIEPLLFYSCRDRSLPRIQSDLLGAHALGLRNILAITGDPAPYALSPGSSAIFDVDSIGLVNVLNNLNRGLDVGGNPLGSQTSFLIGVGANPFAPDPDEQFRRFEYKVQAGGNFALTQPVFDVPRLAVFLDRIRHLPIPVLATITPLTSFRNAEFMNNEVPGIVIPPAMLERMRDADTGDKARAEGVKIAQEILAQVRDLVQGAVISAPFGRYAMAVEVASVLRAESKTDGATGQVSAGAGAL